VRLRLVPTLSTSVPLPFRAAQKRRYYNKALTGDLGRLLERGEDFWVKHNVLVFVFLDHAVAVLDHVAHPVFEGLSHNTVQYVCQPLTGHLRQLLRVGQVLGHLRVLQSLVLHVFDGEAFVLRTENILNVVVLDNCKDEKDG